MALRGVPEVRVVFVVAQTSFTVEDSESNADVARMIAEHGLPDRPHLDYVLVNVVDGVSDKASWLERDGELPELTL